MGLEATAQMKIHPQFSYNGITATALLECNPIEVAEWELPVLQFIREWITDDDFIDVQTSGSTGKPTVWRVKKSAMADGAQITANYFNRHNGTSALLALPAAYIAGKMMLVRAMTQGWNLTSIMPTSKPFGAISHAYDFAAFTPMQLANLEEEELSLLASFGTVIVGGAAIPDALRERLAAGCQNIVETYGMAETLSHIAVRRISAEFGPFEVLPGVEISVDEEQRLRVLVPHISPVYIQTQDVVELVNSGAFYYKGRYDRMINSGGVKLFAEIIEGKLQPVINQPYHVTSLPDEVYGRKVVLYIESELSIDIAELKNRISAVLDRYEIPKDIIVVRQLERTSSGKIKQIRN